MAQDLARHADGGWLLISDDGALPTARPDTVGSAPLSLLHLTQDGDHWYHWPADGALAPATDQQVAHWRHGLAQADLHLFFL